MLHNMGHWPRHKVICHIVRHNVTGHVIKCYMARRNRVLSSLAEVTLLLTCVLKIFVSNDDSDSSYSD